MNTFGTISKNSVNSITYEILIKMQKFFEKHGFHPTNVILSYSDYLILECSCENIMCTEKASTIFGLIINVVGYEREIYVF